MLCAPKKVGSMTFFWGMSSHLDEADSMSWLKRPKKRTSPQIFMSPDSLRVMVIRHPFERLASLYNYMQQGLRVSNLTASFQNWTGYPPIDGMEWLGKEIKKVLGGTPANYKDGINGNKNDGTTEAMHQQDGTTRGTDQMTFNDFVTFLVDKDGKFKDVKEQYDALYYPNAEHWQPYYDYCSTCELLPELILELSNLDEELPVLLRRSQLDQVYPDFKHLERENVLTSRGSTGLTKSAKELFGELGEGQLEDLVEVYKEDFDIHGYDPYSVLY